MTRGAYWAGRALADEVETAEERVVGPPESAMDTTIGIGIGAPGDDSGDADEERPPASIGERIVVGLFAAAALAWIVAVAIVAVSTLRGGVETAALVRGAAIASGPLALIAVLLLLWQRNGSREAARYADAARVVRTETLALDAVLGLASRRLAEDRAAVAGEADRLVTLADDTSTRLREATAGLSREIASLEARNRELDEAAGTARVDMGVLLADLPVAEGQVRALAEELRGAGLAAHEQTEALQAALAGLATRAREAEEANGGGANRLAAQAARLASASDAAARGIDEAEARMTTGIDGVLARAAQAVERTHAGIVAQGEAIDAMIARAAAGADGAATRAGEAMGARTAALAAEIDALGRLLGARDGDAEALIERIRHGLSAVEARFAELDETGRVRTERLGDALGQLWTHAERTMATLNGGGTAATTLINRTETLRAGVRACLSDLDEALPHALDALDARVAASREAIAGSAPAIAEMGGTVSDAADAIVRAGGEIEGRRAALEELVGRIAERLSAARAEATALDEAVAQADTQAGRLADTTTPRLVDALLRIRATAGQAAERAQEALAAIIPQSAAALGEAGRRALDAAVGDAVDAQIARMGEAGERAAAHADAAAERISAGLARVGETSAAVEARLAAGRDEMEARDRDGLSQRSAELIDALNTIAVDVAKLLGAEPGDGAWNAYLKGDRGVFTRRAVRLLDGGEARAVAARYGEDEAFRDLVNRYVRDFEALLRPILAMREGSALAVVLLSSDTGKLYVALAQAIERLRA